MDMLVTHLSLVGKEIDGGLLDTWQRLEGFLDCG